MINSSSDLKDHPVVRTGSGSLHERRFFRKKRNSQFNPYQQLYADPQTYSGQQFYQEAPPLSQGNIQQSPGADQPPSPQPQKRGGLLSQ